MGDTFFLPTSFKKFYIFSVHVHVYVHRYVCVHACVCMSVCVCACVCVRVCMRTCMHAITVGTIGNSGVSVGNSGICCCVHVTAFKH